MNGRAIVPFLASRPANQTVLSCSHRRCLQSLTSDTGRAHIVKKTWLSHRRRRTSPAAAPGSARPWLRRSTSAASRWSSAAAAHMCCRCVLWLSGRSWRMQLCRLSCVRLSSVAQAAPSFVLSMAGRAGQGLHFSLPWQHSSKVLVTASWPETLHGRDARRRSATPIRA